MGEARHVAEEFVEAFNAHDEARIRALDRDDVSFEGPGDVTLTGPGTVILASDWPVVLDTSESRTCVDPNAVVAWSAGLQITTKSSMSAGALIGRGSGEAFQLEFSPGGFVIVEPEPVLTAG